MFVVVAAILGTWFFLSVLNQFPSKIASFLQKKDTFKLMPSFTFFAPNPTEADFHLLYRIVPWKGKSQPWREVPWVKYRSVASIVWNPRRRLQTIVHSALHSMLVYSREHPGDPIQQTPPYRALLNIVTSQCPAQEAASIQYAILRSCMFPYGNQPKLVAKSGFHALSPK